jgi:Protease inhibitor Inh
MAKRSHALLAVTITALLTAGCSNIMSFGRDEPVARAPAPLPSAPTGSVTGATLPPPTGMQPPGMQPPPPSGLAALGAPAAGGAPGAVPGTVGTEVGRTDLLGGWKISAAGDSCQLFMTLTTWAGGYRASTRGCSTATLQGISAWNMEGSQVQLLNDSGSTVARLYPSSRTQFAGQTDGGGPVSVIR